MTFSPLKGFLTLALAAAVAVPAAAKDDAVLQALEDALPGTLLHNPLNLKWVPGGNDIKSKVVPAEDLSTGQAIRTIVKKKQANGWETQIATAIPKEIKAGDKIEIYYYVRTAEAPEGAEAADVSMFFGRRVEPYDSIIFHEFKPSSEWKMEKVQGTAAADFKKNSVKLEYHLGKAAQEVEIGPVYVSVLD